MVHNYLLLCLLGILACFVAPIAGSQAIVGGKKANEKDFRFEVSLQIQGRHFCGGGIIHKLFILTAAHCVIRPDGQFYGRPITVLAGRNDLHATKKDKSSVRVAVKRVYAPTEYKPPTDRTTGDIALLKLEKPLGVWKNRYIKKLKLPEDKKSFIGKVAKIAGFGWQWVKVNRNKDEDGGNFDTQLRFVEADVIDKSSNGCPKDKLLNKKICAKVKQTDSKPHGVCSGDSGGPLVYDGKTVVGILSISPTGCSEQHTAAIYTEVSQYVSLIEDTMKGKKRSDVRTYDLIR